MNPVRHIPPETAEPARRLVVLPFGKSLEIAFKSIRVRFFRSLITTLSLVLAVSFFSFVNVSNDIADGFLATGDANLRQMLVLSGYDLLPDARHADTDPKQRWILVLSMLVCGVGIINAQLMAVTERFREIGTMKCLGALDRFILRLFLLEAGIQGLAGSLAGATAGGIFAGLNALIRFGRVSFTTLSWPSVFASLMTATAVGCLLSLAGVLYPAIMAARMAPVEAMRSEH